MAGPKNAVETSENREQYERLLNGGWSTTALERYAAHRFNEEISAYTFRRHRAKMPPPEETEVRDQKLALLRKDEEVDVFQTRADLIRLQQQRVLTDVGLEIGDRGMNKLFTTTKYEIELLSNLLDAHVRDMQVLGLVPQPGARLDVVHSAASQVEQRSLGDILGSDVDPETLAKVVHLALPRTASNGDAP